MEPKVNNDSNNLKQWLDFTGYTAFVWSILFGGVHVYWALGGTGGFEGRPMGEVLFIINLFAIALCLIAAIIALAFVQSWGRRIPSWLLLCSAWVACVVLALRGGVGVIQSTLQGEPVPLLFLIVEPFFLLGGILFGLVAILYSYCSKTEKK